MTAAEAREKASVVIASINEASYEKAHKAILAAVTAGKFTTRVYEQVPGAVIKRLEAEGYTVKSESHRNEYATKISWEYEPDPVCEAPLEDNDGSFAYGMP